ncbi:MAG: hypothetical protein JXL97_19460 [Bacteroidales bacterium]|nr:hypothetical protein [Bacteroidales bacterium]
MKKILTLLLGILLLAKVGYNQHFIPVDLLVEARDINVALYGGFSLDGSNGAGLIDNLSSTTQSGFIVNALYKVNDGGTQTFHQFIIDINPIIIDWDPFTWNKLIEQPAKSFSVYKMPFQEDAVLHIGWHKNYLSKFYRGGKDQLQHVMFFGEMYFTPYNVANTMDTTLSQDFLRFSVFNVNLGTQYSYVKKDVPVLGNFLIGAALQMNFMLTNESDQYLRSMETAMGNSYKGKQYWGPGAKIVVQTNNLNIYVEGRQYYSMENGGKFTQDPIILVGAFGNINWAKKRNGSTDRGGDDDILE